MTHSVLTGRRLSAGLFTCLALASLAIAGNDYLPAYHVGAPRYEPTIRSSYESEGGESFPRPWSHQSGRAVRSQSNLEDFEGSEVDRDMPDVRPVGPGQFNSRPFNPNAGNLRQIEPDEGYRDAIDPNTIDPYDGDREAPSSMYDSDRWMQVEPVRPRENRTYKPTTNLGDVFNGPSQGAVIQQRRRLPLDNNTEYPTLRAPQSRMPVPQPRTAPKPHSTERPGIQDELAQRYSDSSLLHFASALRPEEGLALYGEVLSYVTERHLQPPTPHSMAMRGLFNLQQALNHPAFQSATRLQIDGQRMAALQQTMTALAAQPVRSERDAVGLLQRTLQQTSQYGLPSSVVMLEFIEGAVDGLDKYSSFLPPETARSQNQQLGESLVGVGVTIENAEGGVRVVKTISGSPAAQAGLRKGDLLVAANGQKLQGVGLDGAISLITGPEGSVAQLAVSRGGQPPVQISVVRRPVQIHSVNEVQMLDPRTRIGYVKLETFASTSTKEMQTALQSLNQQGMQGLILDLRGNPGGLLTTAIELSDMFLAKGKIVSTRGRTAGDNSETLAHYEQTWKMPLVLLVDENSASASEIMAAAVQDNGRGVIVGRHSYGKGTVQTLFPLKTASASLRLTTAKFYSPSGKAMAGLGVEPQVRSQGGTDSQGRDIDILAGIQTLQRLLTTPNN